MSNRSDAQKKRWENMSLLKREEFSQKMSIAAKKRMNSKTPETLQLIENFNKNGNNNSHHRSERAKKQWKNLSEEEIDKRTRSGRIAGSIAQSKQSSRDKKSQTMKARWELLSPEEKRRWTEEWSVASYSAGTSIERAIWKVLDKYHVQYETQKYLGSRRVDIYIPKNRLVIECDGTYWHSLPGAKERDEPLDQWCANNGYKIIRLKQVDIDIDPEQALINSLMRLKYGE